MAKLLDQIYGYAYVKSTMCSHPVTIKTSQLSPVADIMVTGKEHMAKILHIIHRHPDGGMCRITVKDRGEKLHIIAPIV